MQPVLSNYVASITELKKSPTQLLEDAGDVAVAILSDNVVSAYRINIKSITELLCHIAYEPTNPYALV